MVIFGWAGGLFCALLSFYNAGIATDDVVRMLFLSDGIVLIGIVVTLIARWFVKRGRSEAENSH